MDSSMASACKGKPAAAAVPGHHLSERFLTPRWGVSRFGLGTQGGARDAGLPWAGMLRTVGAAPSGPENVQTPGRKRMAMRITWEALSAPVPGLRRYV
jgi:hypothetical protein